MITKQRIQILFCILLYCNLAKAQEKNLRTAPEPNVKKITEWITLLDHNEKIKETLKRMTYTYRPDGQLDSIVGSTFQKHYSSCTYFNNGKISKVYSHSDQDSIFIRHTYYNDREIQDIHLLGQNIVNRKATYRNSNNQITEIKEFEKGKGAGDDFKLIYRQLFNYNEFDSLFAEMHYHYMLYMGDKPTSQTKIVHEYDSETRLRTRSATYDFENNLSEEITYQYNAQGQLLNKTWSYPDRELTKTHSFQYKNGKLWQEEFFNGYTKSVRVYKDGRYIRKKEFGPKGELAYYIDFQYEFY